MIREEAPSYVRVPGFNLFQRNDAVRAVIKVMMDRGAFSLGGLKRAMCSYIVQDQGQSVIYMGMSKANGLHIREMFRLDMCQSGAVRLASGDHVLDESGMAALHVSGCTSVSYTHLTLPTKRIV